MSTISQPQRVFEIAAVAITATGKFIFMTWLDQKLAFTICVTLFWLTYVLYRFKQNPNILKYWGFGRSGFRKTTKPLGIAGIATIVIFVVYALIKGNFTFPWWHLAAILLLYPLWGIVQQFLTMSLVGGNLKDGKFFKLNHGATIILTAFLFGGIHYPNWYLIGATFLLALVYAFFFLKHRNLWPLGLFHGILGTLFYFLVLGRDAFEEIFNVLG